MEPHGYSQTMWFKCISFQQPLCPHQREAQAPVCASVPAAMKKPAATLKKPAVTQADEDQVRPLLLWDIMVQCQNPQKPCGSWVMHKVANRPTCQLCNFPWRKSLQMGGTILHEDWLELQLQEATAATKKPAAMKGKGPTKKDHGKTKVPMSKPTAKTKK